jgi:hypothetical protein
MILVPTPPPTASSLTVSSSSANFRPPPLRAIIALSVFCPRKGLGIIKDLGIRSIRETPGSQLLELPNWGRKIKERRREILVYCEALPNPKPTLV